MKLLPFLLLTIVVLGCIPPRSQNSNTAKSPTPTATPTPTPTAAQLLEKRKAFVVLQEREMLDQGHDFYLSLRGRNQDELVVKYVLMTRVWVHQFQKKYADFIADLADLGFRKITFTDGYNESWSIAIK